LNEGPHTLSVIGRDEAGNWQAASSAAVAGWTVILPSGDLDGDGVTIADALAALRATVGLDILSVEQGLRVDVAPLENGVPAPDGSVTEVDALLILRKALGLMVW
jgi:hypothetical protein